MPYTLGISSMSLGRCAAGHSLTHKLDMAHKYGYRGIELFHEDLADISDQFQGGSTPENQLMAANMVNRLCNARNLKIICLQPFMNYEGLLDRAEHSRLLKKLELWIQLAKVLQTDMIQIPSNYLPASQVSDDLDLIVSDLQKVADIGLQQKPTVRFVYESLGWGTRADTWERCYEIVQRVNRPNFGMCLDTFNIACRIYADPAAVSGRTYNCDEAVRESMKRLATIDISKVFYVQVVDAERLTEPLVKGHPFYNPEQPARMSWSRNCRLFYGEYSKGAYLPVREIASVIFKELRFEGWVSLELFNRRMGDEDHGVPEELARRGAISWLKLARDMGFKTEGAVAGQITASL
jgi:4-hydroxyphenylpyruvate dioxygenase